MEDSDFVTVVNALSRTMQRVRLLEAAVLLTAVVPTSGDLATLSSDVKVPAQQRTHLAALLTEARTFELEDFPRHTLRARTGEDVLQHREAVGDASHQRRKRSSPEDSTARRGRPRHGG